MVTALPPNTVIDGHYKLLSLLGEGGMGAVYKAVEVELERVVAVKLLHEDVIDRDARQRFEREARILSTLEHPNILRFYRFGSWHDRPYIAMEYFEGQSLIAVLRTAHLTCERFFRIADQVCDAMQYAHSRGIIHRDITPSNIMLDAESDRVKLIDFGLSVFNNVERANQHLTNTGTVLGSVYYMSPEQCLGKKADARSDVYSWGCVMYQMVSDTVPFEAENPIALMHQHVSVEPPTLSSTEIPVGLDSVVLRAMSKQPGARHQSMQELRNELSMVAGGKGDLIPPIEVTPDRHTARRLPGVGLIVAMLCALFSIGCVLLAVRPSGVIVPGTIAVATSANPGLRKLRDVHGWPESTSNEQKIAYYSSWLLAHEGSASVVDVISAHTELAALLSEKPEALRHYRLAFDLCKSSLPQAIANGNESSAKQIAYFYSYLLSGLSWRALQPVSDKAYDLTRIDLLKKGCAMFSATRSMSFLPAKNYMRKELSAALLKDRQYKEALPIFLELINCPGHIEPSDRLISRSSAAVCLGHLGRKAEAKRLLDEACTFAEKIQGDLSAQLPLADACVELEQFDAGLKVCLRTEAILSAMSSEKLKRSNSANMLRILRNDKLCCYVALHQFDKEFDTMLELFDSLPDFESRFKSWQRLNQLNLLHSMRRGATLLELMRKELSRADLVLSAEQLVRLLTEFHDTGVIYREKEDTAEYRMMLQCAYLTLPHWRAPIPPPVNVFAFELIECMRAQEMVHQARAINQTWQKLTGPDALFDLRYCGAEANILLMSDDVTAASAVLDGQINEWRRRGNTSVLMQAMLMKVRVIGRRKGHWEEGRAMALEIAELARKDKSRSVELDALFELAVIDVYEKRLDEAIRRLHYLAKEAAISGQITLEYRSRRWLANASLLQQNIAEARLQTQKCELLSKNSSLSFKKMSLMQSIQVYNAMGDKLAAESAKSEYQKLSAPHKVSSK